MTAPALVPPVDRVHAEIGHCFSNLAKWRSAACEVARLQQRVGHARLTSRRGVHLRRANRARRRIVSLGRSALL